MLSAWLTEAVAGSAGVERVNGYRLSVRKRRMPERGGDWYELVVVTPGGERMANLTLHKDPTALQGMKGWLVQRLKQGFGLGDEKAWGPA